AVERAFEADTLDRPIRAIARVANVLPERNGTEHAAAVGDDRVALEARARMEDLRQRIIHVDFVEPRDRLALLVRARVARARDDDADCRPRVPFDRPVAERAVERIKAKPHEVAF